MALIIKEGFRSLDDAVSLRRYYPDQVRRVCSQPRSSRGTPTAYTYKYILLPYAKQAKIALPAILRGLANESVPLFLRPHRRDRGDSTAITTSLRKGFAFEFQKLDVKPIRFISLAPADVAVTFIVGISILAYAF